MQLHERFIQNINENRVNLILKPTNVCNLDCPYCYNRVKSVDPKKMTEDECISIVKKALDEFNTVAVTFHGGEPLLMGKDWYRTVCKETVLYANKNNKKLIFYMQSNGTLIDEEYMSIINEYDIAVGFSFDGTENDNTRKNTDILLNNFKLYEKHRSKCGASLIVTPNNCDKLIEEYELYLKLNIYPKFDPIFNASDIKEDLFVNTDTENMIKGYSKLFDHIMTRNEGKLLSIFEHLTACVLGVGDDRPRVCDNAICNFKWVSIGPHGDMYPCGREWPEEYNMGNINNMTIKEMFVSDKYLNMIKTINDRVNNCFKTCKYASFCYGSCPATVLGNTGKMEGTDPNYCRFFDGLYKHIENYLMDISKDINNKDVIEFIKSTKKTKK